MKHKRSTKLLRKLVHELWTDDIKICAEAVWKVNHLNYKSSTGVLRNKEFKKFWDEELRLRGISDFDKLDTEFRKDILNFEKDRIRYLEKSSENKKKIKSLLLEIENLERSLSIVLSVQKKSPRMIIQPIVSNKNGGENTMVVMASDWHVEQRVDPDLVNNLNSFDLVVAKKRINIFFNNVLKLYEKNNKTEVCKNIVLWLGGDLMNGYLHEEDEESNYLSPIEALLFLYSNLLSGIEFLLSKGIKLKIPCNWGNHGRTTKKLRVATGYKNSYEYLLYCMLAKHFENNPNVEFDVFKGEFGFFNVYDQVFRCSHGYNIKYNFGVGGIVVSALKYIKSQNRIMNADHDLWGHHHEYIPYSIFTQNGSLIGVSPYGRRFGGDKPVQGCLFASSKYGVTGRYPIFCS